jgi:hypothetical protein
MGRAIAQAVSRWFPTAAARVRARVWSCGICGGQSGAVAGFLQVLRFPLPNFIPPIAPQSPSSIIWGLYTKPEVAAVPSGLSPTPQNKKILQAFRILAFPVRNEREMSEISRKTTPARERNNDTVLALRHPGTLLIILS